MQTAGDTWTSQIFGRIDDDEGRVRTVFTDARVKDVVADTLAKVKPLFRDKDAEISRHRRLEGYQLAAVGEHDKALLLFSQAVLRAPQPGHYKCDRIHYPNGRNLFYYYLYYLYHLYFYTIFNVLSTFFSLHLKVLWTTDITVP